MKSLTDLPIEILSIIVRMARDQDERLKERLRTSRYQMSAMTRSVMRLSKWYGHSLLALHATSKALEGLAKPLVFESVKLSKSAEDIFLGHIVPNYSMYIKSAIFDEDHEDLEAVTQGFIFTLRDLSALISITFENRESIERFQAFYNEANGAITSPESATRRACRPLFIALNQRITRLVCLDATYAQMKFLTLRFTNLRYLKRRICAAESGVDDDGDVEREGYGTLKYLEELDTSTLSHEREHNLRRLSHWPPARDWSEKWTTMDWSTITTFRLTVPQITKDDWVLVTRFRQSLVRLELTSISVDQDLYEEEEECIAFPNLRSLTLTGDFFFMKKILRLLKLSPIVAMDFKLVSASGPMIPGLVFRDKDQYSVELEPFGATLRSLRLSDFTLCIPRLSQQEDLNLREGLQRKGVSIGYDTTGDTGVFYKIGEPIYSVDMEDHTDRKPAVYTCPPMYHEIRELANYVLLRSYQAVMQKDAGDLNRLAHLLRPMKAKQIMERE